MLKTMKEITTDDRLFFFERSYFTLDGLWILETEKATDFDTALKIDLAVWLALLKIIYKRIKDYLKADTSTVQGLVDVLAFRWACEKWDFSIEQPSQREARATIKKCPYKEIMDRSEGRKVVIPRICKDICIPIYESAIASLNPAVHIKRTAFMGLGDRECRFELKMD
jgi:hypothetical protein